MTEHGQVPSFKLKSWLDCVYALIDADEVERALWMLSNLPAYYRDHEPQEIKDLRAQVQSKLITAHGYMSSRFDCDVYTVEKAQNVLSNTLRGRLIWQELRALKQAGKTAHIVDLGPGEYWLPIGLQSLGYKFRYDPISMDLSTREQFDKIYKHEPVSGDLVRIFVALEVIEHVSDTSQLRWEALKHFNGHAPDVVHISTPCYTYDARPKQWQQIGLPHLRAYTPREFLREAERLFPENYAQLFLDPVMSIRMTPHQGLDGVKREFSLEDLSQNIV